MPGIPFAKRYLSPVGAAKGTPPRTKAALATRAPSTEKAPKKRSEGEEGNAVEPAK